jgi:hypothetical protein
MKRAPKRTKPMGRDEEGNTDEEISGRYGIKFQGYLITNDGVVKYKIMIKDYEKEEQWILF